MFYRFYCGCIYGKSDESLHLQSILINASNIIPLPIKARKTSSNVLNDQWKKIASHGTAAPRLDDFFIIRTIGRILSAHCVPSRAEALWELTNNYIIQLAINQPSICCGGLEVPMQIIHFTPRFPWLLGRSPSGCLSPARLEAAFASPPEIMFSCSFGKEPRSGY